MRILFVWTNKDTFGCKPMGISLLSAILQRDGHEVDLFDTSFMDVGGKDYNQEMTRHGYFKPVDWGCDVSKKEVDLEEELSNKVQQFRPDLIAISLLSDEVALAQQIIIGLEDITAAPILVGNKGAEALFKMMPDRGVTYCFGEFAGIIGDVVKFNQFIGRSTIHSPGYFKDLDSLPMLDWSLFDDRHFLKAYDGKVYRGGDHMIGWGCTNSCAYCINEHWREIHGGMKGCIRRYSVNRIIDELQALMYSWDLQFFKFHDEDFLLKPMKYLEHLAQEYVMKVDLPFTCMTNAKSVTPDKVELLKAMGCVSVSIGIETGNPIMRQMLRRRETPEDIVRANKLLTDAGIRVSAFNMIGLPHENEETIKETIELNRKAGIKHPNCSLFIPLEGTLLYDISVKSGYFKPGKKELRTDEPSLSLPGISRERLLWYYHNFHDLVTKG